MMRPINLKFIAIIVCLGFLTFSCDEVKELVGEPEVDINTSFVIPIAIDVDALSNPNQQVTFAEIGAYDLLTNPQIAEEVGEDDRIKEVVINSITYEFRNFSGNVDADVDGRFLFIIDSEPEIFDLQTVNAAESDLLETVYNLSGNFDLISEKITETKLVFFNYDGTSTHNPVAFTLEVVISATVTVELNLDDL